MRSHHQDPLADPSPPADNQVNRPHLWSLTASNVEMRYLKVRPIAWAFAAGGKNLYIHHLTIEAISSTSAFPFNVSCARWHGGSRR